MISEVHHEIHDGVSVITLDRPVANALAPSVRSSLSDVLGRSFEDNQVRAVVLCGAGSGFSSGVDILEYDGPLSKPWVSDLCNLIETATKPVVACLHGAVLGAGFELALAAHARVACHGTRLALPEVKLGLIPGGGATQRLPRIVGAQAALEFMLSGQAVNASDSRMARLFDRLVESDPLPVAIDLARDLADKGRWCRTCDCDRGFSAPEKYQKTIGSVWAQLPDDEGPETDLVKCVEAAPLLPFALGLEFEQVLFQDRLAAPSARARRHIYIAEKHAEIWPEISQNPKPRTLTKVAVLGSGPLVSEVVVALLEGGKEVLLAAPTQEAAGQVLTQVVRVYQGAVARKTLDVAQRYERLARLSRHSPAQAIAEADLVLDAGLDLSQDDLAQRPAGAVWAVMSGGNKGGFASVVQRTDLPGCVGVRFCRPAHGGRVVEVIVPDPPDRAAVAEFVRTIKDLGRIAIRVSDVPGGVGDAIRAVFYQAALALAAGGITPYEIDDAARDLGFVRGPFEMMDAEGLGRVAGRLAKMGKFNFMPDLPHNNLLRSRIDAGATGQNAGKGIYLYPKGAPVGRDCAVLSWCEENGEEHGWPVSGVAPDVALLSAIVNAAARLIYEKDVQRASDIDVCIVNGLGFDRRKGGPLLQADLKGMLQILKALHGLEPFRPDIWRPHTLVQDMVKNGQSFFGRAV